MFRPCLTMDHVIHVSILNIFAQFTQSSCYVIIITLLDTINICGNAQCMSERVFIIGVTG